MMPKIRVRALLFSFVCTWQFSLSLLICMHLTKAHALLHPDQALLDNLILHYSLKVLLKLTNATYFYEQNTKSMFDTQ